MKIITKLLFTLALTLVGLGGVKAANPGILIKEVDFSTMTEYGMWKSSLVNLSINAGTLQIENETATNNWEIQYEGATGLSLKEHGNYIVRLTLKGSEPGSLTCVLGTWQKSKNTTASFTTEMTAVDFVISDFPEAVGDAHILLQSGAFIGTINISKVQVFEAYEAIYPEPNKYDISLNADDWTTGWNATAANEDNNLNITLTGDYGAKGIRLTDATLLSKCNKIIVVIESYEGGWGQLLIRSNGTDVAAKGYGNVIAGSPQTVTIEYDPAANIDEFFIQCGSGTPTITVSRVYLVEKVELIPGSVVFSYDYAGRTADPWWHDDDWGTKPTVSDGALTATNNEERDNVSNYAFFVADNISTNENRDYFVRATIKGSVAGSIVCNLGNWGQSSEKTLSFTDEYQEVDILISGVPTATDCHILFKIGKYVGTIYLKKIEVYEALVARTITVSNAGFSTFSADYTFDTSGLVKAYAATFDSGEGKINLTPISTIPANVGVIIEAAQGTYNVPIIQNTVSMGDITNELLVSDGTVTGNGDIYALGKKNGVVGFYRVAGGETVPAGKAYLTISSTARDFYALGDETTGIVGNKREPITNNCYYDLQGRKVNGQLKKGLYIVNGKKVIIK